MDSTLQLLERHRVCILVPTFNNLKTLVVLLSELKVYHDHVVVVNDGSTDDTGDALSTFPEVHSVSYFPNRGKGYALRKGFGEAVNMGYDYVISIDSDGQHYTKDLPAFLEMLDRHSGSLIVGSRNMDQASVPGKSSFGHRFSNFWYRVETGIRLPDTQSGYRLYPVYRLQRMHFLTNRFEFEIEVLVRAAWAGIPVLSVPVSVYYPPGAERVSHFRPFTDFTRISLLNTFLVTFSFLYIKPRDLFRRLFVRHKWKEVFVDELFDPSQSVIRKSVSVAFGVFMGILPIWGFQLVTAIFLAILLRLNKGLVILFANISIIPLVPLILYASFRFGAFWMPSTAQAVPLTKSLGLSAIRSKFSGYNLEQYLAGSISLAIVAGILTGTLTFILLRIFSKKPPAIV